MDNNKEVLQRCRKKYRENGWYRFAQGIFMLRLGFRLRREMEDPEFMEGYQTWRKENGKEEEE